MHQRFLPGHVDAVRARYPGIQVIVHPECRWEVCQKADAWGSTERLIKMVEAGLPEASLPSAPRSTWSIVWHEAFASEDKKIITLDDTGCLCTTMYRISPQHLAWALENLVEERVVNRIKVREDVKHWARVALDRMLEVRAEWLNEAFLSMRHNHWYRCSSCCCGGRSTPKRSPDRSRQVWSG